MVQQSTNTIFENVYKFNGKELDEQTGYYYYGARYYDPATSIFLSVDPLAEDFPNFTPYHYVHNNPINLIDPTGMSADGWRENDSTGQIRYDESYTSENTPEGYTYFDGGIIDKTLYNTNGTSESIKGGTTGCVDCHHDGAVGSGDIALKGALERATLWGDNTSGGDGGKSYRGQLVKSFSFDAKQFPVVGVGGATLKGGATIAQLGSLMQYGANSTNAFIQLSNNSFESMDSITISRFESINYNTISIKAIDSVPVPVSPNSQRGQNLSRSNNLKKQQYNKNKNGG